MVHSVGSSSEAEHKGACSASAHSSCCRTTEESETLRSPKVSVPEQHAVFEVAASGLALEETWSYDCIRLERQASALVDRAERCSAIASEAADDVPAECVCPRGFCVGSPTSVVEDNGQPAACAKTLRASVRTELNEPLVV
jgi:hypothetical protein